MRVTACLPSIPPRGEQLQRALDSVRTQTKPVAAVSLAYDLDHLGAGPTRNMAMEAVNTEWLAFLDDDDEWMPHHIEACCRVAEESDADVVIPWFLVVGGADPFPANRYKEALVEDFPSFGITCLVRREAIGDLRFAEPQPGAIHGHEDYTFWLTLAQGGAKMVKIPDITWIWHHWGYGQPGKPGNCSGRPDRW